MQKTVEESALQSPPEIDTRAFLWTFESLDEDHELERFFAGLPGFRASKMVKDPLSDITAEQHGRLSETLIGLLDRTFSSDLLPEPVKIRRTVICTKAFHPADIPRASRQVLYGIGSEDQYGPVQSAEIARLVRGWDNGRDEETTVIMQAIVLSVLARAQQRDDLWFTMASNEMGIPESVLRNHAAHGDSLSLAILIHITRKQLSCFMEQYWPWPQFSKNLEAASKFDVLNTSHKLQHEFCALWNQIVRKVQDDGVRLLAYFALQRIRNVYAALHGSTDSAPTHFSVSTGDDDILLEPSSYPLCNIPDHRLDSTPHVHDVPASSTTAHAALHENTAPVPVYPADTPTVPSSSVPATLHVDDSENRKDVPPLDKVQVPFYPTHQTAMESPSIPSTSSDPATTVGATRDIETPAGAMLSTTLATSTFSSFVSPTNAVSFQNTTNILVHSNAPAIPPSASAGLVLDDITEPHCSILTTKSPGTSPRLNSAPEPGSAQCSPSADSSEDKDTSDPLPVTRAIQANTMPPQLQPLLSATDIAIAGPSHRDSDVGKTGGHTPHTSHG
ncbi:hypothetical protein EI94DRAFT_865754 [Lactarius quietus]|nr:hypothetical protein EI94DRAFT_865754 [Lactarius quietus]